MQSRFVKRYKGRTSRTACPSLTASVFVASSVLASRLILLRLLPRRSCALCGGCGGVLGGQSVQYAAAVFGGDGLLHKGLELLLGQRDGVGQQLLDKPHALAEAVRPVLALLLFLLLDKPLFLVGKEKIKNLKFLLDNSFRISYFLAGKEYLRFAVSGA